MYIWVNIQKLYPPTPAQIETLKVTAPEALCILFPKPIPRVTNNLVNLAGFRTLHGIIKYVLLMSGSFHFI